MGVSKNKYFRSHDKTLAPLFKYDIVLLNNSFDSKRDAAEDAASSGYSSLLLPTVNLTLKGYDFSGW